MPYPLLCEASVGCVAQSLTHTSTVSLCLLGDRRANGVILRLFRLLQLGSHSTPTYSGSTRCRYQCAARSLQQRWAFSWWNAVCFQTAEIDSMGRVLPLTGVRYRPGHICSRPAICTHCLGGTTQPCTHGWPCKGRPFLLCAPPSLTESVCMCVCLWGVTS